MRHVVLIGLPGAGKSTVGPLIAEALGIPFVDLDVRIAARTGRAVGRIFAESGEPAFRALERAEMDAALGEPAAVIAPGGGWAAQPGAIDAARPHARILYMRCDPTAAARRLGAATGRPLLAGGNVEARLRALLDAREAAYTLADATVEAEGEPRVVADRILNLLKSIL